MHACIMWIWIEDEEMYRSKHPIKLSKTDVSPKFY